MGSLITNVSAVEGFPQTDLPADYADGIIPPLMNAEIFAATHGQMHRMSTLFTMGHSAMELSAGAALKDDPRRVQAMLLGCSIFEAISGGVSPECYDGDAERAVVYEVARRFVAPPNVRALPERSKYAAQRMRDDTPVLHSAVSEIAGLTLDYNEAAILHALQGAGMMRGMQIKADRVLVP